ncbi:MAG: hypothetical protein DIU83_07815 [Bacillota bacterium]|nr:MAG: hypothetical protein DIU83_07815 [Bacillota bacterium]
MAPWRAKPRPFWAAAGRQAERRGEQRAARDRRGRRGHLGRRGRLGWRGHPGPRGHRAPRGPSLPARPARWPAASCMPRGRWSSPAVTG